MTAMADPPRRRRDAAKTKAAILDAARIRFAADSYDRVTVHQIAALAGANVALINRYFGSKEGLFLAALGGGPMPDDPFPGDLAGLGERLVRAVLGRWAAAPAADPIVLVVRSAAARELRETLRAVIDEAFVRRLAMRLSGPDAELRAQLVGSHLLGLAVMRDLLGAEPIAATEIERLATMAGPVLQRYIDGERGDRQ